MYGLLGLACSWTGACGGLGEDVGGEAIDTTGWSAIAALLIFGDVCGLDGGVVGGIIWAVIDAWFNMTGGADVIDVGGGGGGGDVDTLWSWASLGGDTRGVADAWSNTASGAGVSWCSTIGGADALRGSGAHVGFGVDIRGLL